MNKTTQKVSQLQKQVVYSAYFLKNAIILRDNCRSKEAQEKLSKLKKTLEYEQSKISTTTQ